VPTMSAQVVSVEVEQVEGYDHDPGRLARQFVLQHRESVVPSAAGTTISPSRIAEEAWIRKALSATFFKRSSGRDHCA
jgi:hypothetical protein